jgi:hypothetical protein
MIVELFFCIFLLVFPVVNWEEFLSLWSQSYGGGHDVSEI